MNILISFFPLFQYLADIEDHLNCTIQQIDPDIKVPCDEFDGKVVYGQKKASMGMDFEISLYTAN